MATRKVTNQAMRLMQDKVFCLMIVAIQDDFNSLTEMQLAAYVRESANLYERPFYGVLFGLNELQDNVILKAVELVLGHNTI